MPHLQVVSQAVRSPTSRRTVGMLPMEDIVISVGSGECKTIQRHALEEMGGEKGTMSNAGA